MKTMKHLTCTKCGKALETDSKFCSTCGAVLYSASISGQRPSSLPEVSKQASVLPWVLVAISALYMIVATSYLSQSIYKHYSTQFRIEQEMRIAEENRRAEERDAKERLKAQRIAKEKKIAEEEKQRVAESEAKRLAEIQRQQKEKTDKILQEKQLAEENRAKEDAEAKRQQEISEKKKKGSETAKVIKDLFAKKEYAKILEFNDDSLEYSGEVQFILAQMYVYGSGVTADKDKALNHYRKAAELGEMSAQYAMGMYYYDGRWTKTDKTEAEKWFRLAANQGHGESQYYVGVCYSLKREYKEASIWYTKAAEKGHRIAQYNLGVMYDEGNFFRQDITEAMNWYKKSADQGWPQAQFNLGVHYDNKGQYQASAKYYTLAAQQGYLDAQSLASHRVCRKHSSTYDWHILCGGGGKIVNHEINYF